MSSKPAQSDLNFTKEELQDLREAIQAYFLDELDMEIGTLQADLFIEFLQTNVGKQFYNRGVQDTIKALREKTEDLVLLLKE